MWVHPDLTEDDQWTIVTSKRKHKVKNNMGCYVISLRPGGYYTSASLLTDSDKEQIVFMADATSPIGTRLGKQCLK